MNRKNLLNLFTVYLSLIFFIILISCVETIYKDEDEDIDKPFEVTVPTSGLVAYYPFNGNADDFSGNGLNGTIIPEVIPQPSFTSDRNSNINSAFFTGTGYVQVPHNNLLNLQDFTVSAWIRMEAIPSAFNCFIGKDYDTNFSIGIISGGSGLCAAAVTRNMRISIGGSSLLFSDFSCGSWYHIAVTYDYLTGTVQLYINGTYAGSGNILPAIIQDNSYNLGIGRDGHNGDQFTGTIDEVCIYNRVLTSAEINSLYSN